jgi:hypothetical protein
MKNSSHHSDKTSLLLKSAEVEMRLQGFSGAIGFRNELRQTISTGVKKFVHTIRRSPPSFRLSSLIYD